MEIKILNTFCCTSECFPLNYCKQHNFQDIIVDLARCYVKPWQSFSYLLLPVVKQKLGRQMTRFWHSFHATYPLRKRSSLISYHWNKGIHHSRKLDELCFYSLKDQICTSTTLTPWGNSLNRKLETSSLDATWFTCSWS